MKKGNAGIKIARRKLCQSMIAKSRIIRKNRIIIPKPLKTKSRIIRKKCRIIIPKPSKMKPEPTQNDSKNDAEIGLLKKSEKVTIRIPFRFIAFGPKSDQNPPSCDLFKMFGIQKGIRKSMPKKYGKNMPEGPQNGTKMDAKTINVSYFFKKGENGRNCLFYNIKLGFC